MPRKPTPEKAREYNKRAWEKRKRNPAKLAKTNAQMRVWAAQRRVDAVKNPRIWAAAHLSFIRYRAKKMGLPFNLTEQDILTPEHCEITGWRLVYGNRQICRDSPSVDRKIPLLGYVRGNVRTISHYANTLRGNCLQPAFFEALARDATAIRQEFEIDG